MDEVNAVLAQSIVTVGDSALTVGALLRAVIILLGAALLAWAVRRLSRRMQHRIGEERASAVYIGAQAARYIIFFSGLSIAVS
ncbi:MAG TPA: hypothetical protein VFF89_05905, partial [Sphingobium sp.]|nr:hypothetical protein [Sphingobium sp.]